jgi:predicted ferric reductase
MLTGLAAFIWRIVVRDAVMPGHKNTVHLMEGVGSVTTLALAPKNRPLLHRAGQFAFVKTRGAARAARVHHRVIARLAASAVRDS